MNAKTLLILPLVVLAACGGKKANVEQTEAEQTDAISQEVKDFTSPDLELYELHSKVAVAVRTLYTAEEQNGQNVKKTPITADTLYFNESGLLVRQVSFSVYNNYVSGESVYTVGADGNIAEGKHTSFYLKGGKSNQTIKVTRDSEGRIVNTEFKTNGAVDSDEDNSNEYEWKDGKVVTFTYRGWEWTSSFQYTYDERGLRATRTCEESDEGELTKSNESYNYTAFDDFGNWTERVVTQKADTYVYDYSTDKEKLSESTTTVTIEHQDITYYE